jgi:hypothetical protein
MNKEMKDGTASIGAVPEGKIVIETYPNGSFEICVLNDFEDGYVVAEGVWKDYKEELTNDVWNKLVKES